MPNILFLDIEASNLAANFGYVFCVGYKWMGEKETHILSVLDRGGFKRGGIMTDEHVVRRFAKVVERADAIVTHYGKRFDIPFLNTRLLFYHLPPLAHVQHVDLWEIARKHLKFNSNRQDTISDFLGESHKTKLRGQMWVMAAMGHKPSIRYIIDHCEKDILDLEKNYKRLAPFLPFHPRLFGSDEKCPVCGGYAIRRGTRIAIKRKWQRWQCQDKECGHWFTGRPL